MSDHLQYFDYLRQRSVLGNIYRRFWLHPKVSRYLVGKTLDVGCGLGGMVQYRPNTVGVDINPYNVKYGTDHGLNILLMVDDQLPFENAQFDCVLLDNVLEHLAKPKPLLHEIKRILVPGGRLVIGVPGLLGMKADEDHKVFYGEIELEALAKQVDFEPIEFFYTPLWRSILLSNLLRQYCTYSIWRAS